MVLPTHCTECMEGDVKLAKYVGESARSAKERFSEHMEDADNQKADSHMYKHWQNQHGGRRTEFLFTIVSFHLSALDRQIAEAVRISRTGGEKILNSKGEYNRCELPRIVAADSRVIPSLGDTPAADETGIDEQEVQVAQERIKEKRLKKEARKEKLRDLLRWGEGGGR